MGLGFGFFGLRLAWYEGAVIIAQPLCRSCLKPWQIFLILTKQHLLFVAETDFLILGFDFSQAEPWLSRGKLAHVEEGAVSLSLVDSNNGKPTQRGYQY